MHLAISRRAALRGGIATATALSLRAPARAQAWPNQPLKFICSHPAGGLTDAFARSYGDYIGQKLGQPVVVENKSGAGGQIAAQAVATAQPDGHTLLVTISSTLLGNRVLYKKLPYDPDKDFSFIALMPSGHLPLLVHRSTGATTLKEFVEYARKNTVSIGTYGAGSFPHIVTATLNRQYGLKMVAVHYRGESPMWQDFAAGSLQAACGSYQAALGALQSGNGRAVAVPQRVRMKKLPDVPTFAEQGFSAPVFQALGYIAFLGPAGIPEQVAERLSYLAVEAGKSERIVKLLDTFGIDDAAKDRAFFRRTYETEGAIWINAVKDLDLAQQ
jgi:tripartite-type tricarboxylate transporter receptor subunit TctC